MIMEKNNLLPCPHFHLRDLKMRQDQVKITWSHWLREIWNTATQIAGSSFCLVALNGHMSVSVCLINLCVHAHRWRLYPAVFAACHQGSHFLAVTASIHLFPNPLPSLLSLHLPAMCCDCISHCAHPHSGSFSFQSRAHLSLQVLKPASPSSTGSELSALCLLLMWVIVTACVLPCVQKWERV